ncbi:hypothetical protein TgHK011_001772 [Trichoderma gracile]|nr:hypothetical protein TgHK011_001772 [Trichoderma gracile]
MASSPRPERARALFVQVARLPTLPGLFAVCFAAVALPPALLASSGVSRELGPASPPAGGPASGASVLLVPASVVCETKDTPAAAR